MRGPDRRQRVDQVLHALLVHQPAGVHEQRARRPGPAGRGPRCAPRPIAVQRSTSMPFGTTSTRSGASSNRRSASSRADVEQVIVSAERRASQRSTEWIAWLSGRGNQPSCRPASVACSVVDERGAGVLGQGDRALRDEPVVGVDDVGPPAPHERQRGPQHGVLGRLRPRQQRLGGEVDRERVERGRASPRTPSRRSCARRASVPRVTTRTSCPAAPRARASASTWRPRPADDEGRVLPRQHQHPHGDGH